MDLPRVTFGVIVLNGEPFTRYCLRALYPFAHEIIVVEGAAPGAAAIATADGHSRDGTLDVLRAFQREEDPQGKLQIVTAEDAGHPNGFWPGEKHEQSQAYAQRATGDYLWQIDIDEFYRAADMQAVVDRLAGEPEISAVSFLQRSFWGGFDYTVDGWHLRQGAEHCHRIFRWGPGYQYVTHRPPTVVDEAGRDVREGRWLDGHALARDGIELLHFSLVFPRQVHEKCAYYGAARWARADGAQRWAREAFDELRRPLRVHNVYDHPSWLERYRGELPEQIAALRRDLASGAVREPLRRTDDIERLLASPIYALQRGLLKLAAPWVRRRRESTAAWVGRLVRHYGWGTSAVFRQTAGVVRGPAS